MHDFIFELFHSRNQSRESLYTGLTSTHIDKDTLGPYKMVFQSVLINVHFQGDNDWERFLKYRRYCQNKINAATSPWQKGKESPFQNEQN